MAGVQHIDLVVSSIERSLPFYRELLAPLGYHRISEVEGERGETIWYLSGPGVAIGLREASPEGAHDRYARRRPPHRVRGLVAGDRRRAGRLADRARRRDRERPRGVRLPARLLRRVLLRPRRDKAGDSAHPRPGSLERSSAHGRFRPAPGARLGRPHAPHAAVLPPSNRPSRTRRRLPSRLPEARLRRPATRSRRWPGRPAPG